MKFYIENVSLKEFTNKISVLDKNISSRIIMRDEIFPIELAADFVEKHVEIQNAIMMIKNSEVSDYTIFMASYGKELLDMYEKILCMLFKNVTYLTNDNFVGRFIVSCCRKESLEIYNILEERKELNSYISLFEHHKKYKSYGNDYSLYKISVMEKGIVLKNDFINWCINAIKNNPYISLSICGFTLKEIKEKKELINIFTSFSDIYILFCGEYSVGGYAINNDFIIEM